MVLYMSMSEVGQCQFSDFLPVVKILFGYHDYLAQNLPKVALVVVHFTMDQCLLMGAIL